MACDTSPNLGCNTAASGVKGAEKKVTESRAAGQTTTPNTPLCMRVNSDADAARILKSDAWALEMHRSLPHAVEQNLLVPRFECTQVEVTRPV